MNNHPIKAIYNRHMNTITQHLHWGKLDEQTAKKMKRLAKNKLNRAIREVAYAQGDHTKEMEQDALLKKATAKS